MLWLSPGPARIAGQAKHFERSLLFRPTGSVFCFFFNKESIEGRPSAFGVPDLIGSSAIVMAGA
jgi:hypothetical protein